MPSIALAQIRKFGATWSWSRGAFLGLGRALRYEPEPALDPAKFAAICSSSDWGFGVAVASARGVSGGWGGLGVSGLIGDTMLPLCRPEYGGTIPPASSAFESVEGAAPRDEALGERPWLVKRH